MVSAGLPGTEPSSPYLFTVALEMLSQSFGAVRLRVPIRAALGRLTSPTSSQMLSRFLGRHERNLFTDRRKDPACWSMRREFYPLICHTKRQMLSKSCLGGEGEHCQTNISVFLHEPPIWTRQQCHALVMKDGRKMAGREKGMLSCT